ncbi:Radical SAM domain protein [Pyrolobus fumarii 1A]|uniref:Radical SAM domain protein n=1 Tax=Pyrolobus fumarii (strain DSM 11204 / 1A) TaxID=694429 RepID=G0ED68_PYRF1|nr:radical SAM protein [Pyrolobus fumarii]AEM39746.1 Radical SAM domain protein [Pyrolobus fumarii 1A]
MAREYIHVENVYAYTGVLPGGCQLCLRGEKMVVFVTGLCNMRCFYCPVSPKRLGRDVVYVDEERARSLEDVVLEAFRVGARGASITGGEPLIVLKRVTSIVKRLKEAMGSDFHIHLYTSGHGLTATTVRILEEAGLDELRIHPVEDDMWRVVEVAVKARRRMSVGVEIPVFPDRVEELKRRIKWLEEIGADFINLNEVEVTPHTLESIVVRGYRVRGYVVEGSYEAGLEIVKWAARELRRITVHFCPALYKDRVQHRNRLIRKAVRVAAHYEEPTERGTLTHIEAICTPETLRLVEEGYGVKHSDKCLLHPSVAEELKKLGAKAWLVETYPDSERTLVSRQPLSS